VKVSSDMSLSRQGFESIEVMGGWFGIKGFTGTGWRVSGLVGGKLGFAIEVRGARGVASESVMSWRGEVHRYYQIRLFFIIARSA
jgi:hypothetical protein